MNSRPWPALADVEDSPGQEGGAFPGGLDINGLEARRQRFAEFRASIAARPMAPLAYLEIYPKPDYASAVSEARRLLAEGWEMGGTLLPTIEPPIPWEGHPRSFEFHLNAWQPIQRLLLAFDLGRSWRYFRAALAMAEDWLAACPVQLAGQSLEEAVALVCREYERGSWWYDMAIAQRLYRLAYIIDVCCRTPDISDGRIAVMMDHLLLHHAVLDLDMFYKSGTNHGFFQALNQYAAVKRLPEFDVGGYLHDVSQSRLAQMTARQFTQDMVHLEHSPGYHYMVTVALMNADRAGLLGETEKSGLRQAEANMGWMVTPSGHLTTFGDSDPRRLFNPTEAAFFEEPSLVGLLRGVGRPPTGVRHFAEAGYAFARLFADDVAPVAENASYLAQTAAFHSRTHKHADHLAFVWHDKGRPILIDPARYAYAGRTVPGSELHKQGFWYSDPKRIYCESTRAHNTVLIDGRDFPRTKVKPFGSALAYAGEVDGYAVTYCEATHFRSVRHNRQLVMGPGRFLLVLDWLYDRTGELHDYRQFFHFAPEWDVFREGDAIAALHSGDQALPPLAIRAASLVEGTAWGPVVRGQEEPQMLGWMSDKANSLVPTNCFHVSQAADGPAVFATLFVFGRTLEIDRKATRFNRSLSAGQVVWVDERGSMAIQIRKPERPGPAMFC